MMKAKRMRSMKTTKMMKRRKLMNKFAVDGRIRRRNAGQEFALFRILFKFLIIYSDDQPHVILSKMMLKSMMMTRRRMITIPVMEMNYSVLIQANGPRLNASYGSRRN
jgi:hypothetical protein